VNLESILRKGVTLGVAAVLALGPTACKNDIPEPIPHFEVKYAITDADGLAHFTDNESGSFTIPVLDGDGSRSIVEEALVVMFDGEDGDAFYAEHPGYNTPGFDVFAGVGNESNSNAKSVSPDVSLSLTSNTWQGWKLTEENGEQHKVARDFVEWATQEPNNGWGYYGCTTFEEMEDGHKFATVLYAAAEKTGLVTVVNSVSETITSVLQIITGELETYEAEQCEAFQFFGFIPNYDGWVSPVGGIVIPFCYTPHDTETFTDNGVDDDCNGIIDEGGPGDDDDDTGDDDDTTPATSCTGSEYLCDDFEDNSFDASLWDVESGNVDEENGMLKFDSDSAISSYFPTSLVSDQYSFKLLSEIVAGDWYTVTITNNDLGWVSIDHQYGEISAFCYDIEEGGFAYGDDMSLATDTRFDLEFSQYGGHSSVFVNDSILFSQDNCYANDSTSDLQLIVETHSGEGVELEKILVEEF
tara:strand:- start:125 stop:1534 length:1410 start_codon:yes stop_codon:yes gene_type:complete